MSVQKLEKARWGRYFDVFSKHLPVQMTQVVIQSASLGNQTEAEWLQMHGITYDHKDDIVVISLEGLEHIIHRPVTIHVDHENGIVAGLEVIDAQSVRHRVQLRKPLALPGHQVAMDEVDEAGLESFPASDPPAWSG